MGSHSSAEPLLCAPSAEDGNPTSHAAQEDGAALRTSSPTERKNVP